MAKVHKRYAAEFRCQMVELHRAGRSFHELSKEFGCSAWTIRYWVKQADRDSGRGDGGLTAAEREALLRLFPRCLVHHPTNTRRSALS